MLWAGFETRSRCSSSQTLELRPRSDSDRRRFLYTFQFDWQIFGGRSDSVWTRNTDTISQRLWTDAAFLAVKCSFLWCCSKLNFRLIYCLVIDIISACSAVLRSCDMFRGACLLYRKRAEWKQAWRGPGSAVGLPLPDNLLQWCVLRDAAQRFRHCQDVSC
jgi:hypothetical protein